MTRCCGWLEEEGGVPSRLIKTDAGDGRQEGTPWRSYDEIAEAEGITRTSTNKQIAKARRNLRKITGEGGQNEPPDA